MVITDLDDARVDRAVTRLNTSLILGWLHLIIMLDKNSFFLLMSSPITQCFMMLCFSPSPSLLVLWIIFKTANWHWLEIHYKCTVHSTMWPMWLEIHYKCTVHSTVQYSTQYSTVQYCVLHHGYTVAGVTLHCSAYLVNAVKVQTEALHQFLQTSISFSREILEERWEIC